jgi:hypothetical protein
MFSYIQLNYINFELINLVLKLVEDDARHTDVLRNRQLRNAK